MAQCAKFSKMANRMLEQRLIFTDPVCLESVCSDQLNSSLSLAKARSTLANRLNENTLFLHCNCCFQNVILVEFVISSTLQTENQIVERFDRSLNNTPSMLQQNTAANDNSMCGNALQEHWALRSL